MPRSTTKKGAFSGKGRSALRSRGRRKIRAAAGRQQFRNEPGRLHRWQGGQRRQRRTEIVCGKTKFASMRRQAILVVRRVPEGMRPRRQLGEQENGDEKEMAQRIHGLVSIDLDEQTFEIFAFGKVQGHRMIGSASQAPHDAGIAPGIQRRAGDDLLEQLEPNATGTRVGH
jgi:hypothetical protein